VDRQRSPGRIDGLAATARSSTLHVLARLRRALDAIDWRGGRFEIAQRARAQAVLDTLTGIPAAILVANDRGRYIDANARAAALTGYSREELLKLSVWDLTPPLRQGLGRRLWREFLQRGRMSGEYRLRRKSGRIVKTHYFASANVLRGIHVSALITPVPAARRARSRRTGSSRHRR